MTLQDNDRNLILIIDDDPSFRLLLGKALESAGLRVVEAEDGTRALALLAHCKPNLIMLDVMMPGMDGFETYRGIRDIPETVATPIVMVTGNDDLLSIQRAYDLGVTDFITKPISWGVIGYRVNFLLRATEAFAELVKAKEAVEAANQTKSRFLNNMSHELRTPMSGILGMIQLTQLSPLTPTQRNYLDLARSSGLELIRIIENILDLTSIEARTVTLRNEPFSVRQCLAATVNIMAPEAISKGLELTASVADDVPETVMGNQVRLQQVLTNLVGNALKFTRQGSVTVKITSEPLGIAFAVTDSGIGIPVEQQNLLFKPFSQGDDSSTRAYGGVGLGLVITRELVELMGGGITLHSIEGHGSTFSFTLPLAATAPNQALPTPQAPPPAGSALAPHVKKEGPPLILLADDDYTNRELLRHALLHEKYLVETADDGLQLVEKWEQGAYDLIILNIRLPVMDGITAVWAIRTKERERGGHTPMLAMTDDTSPDDKERYLASGIDACLAKPVDLSDLIAVVGGVSLNGMGAALLGRPDYPFTKRRCPLFLGRSVVATLSLKGGNPFWYLQLWFRSCSLCTW